MKKLINLLLAASVILSSCSKEDDLLTPVNNTNTTQITDTTSYTVTGIDTPIVCSWDTTTNNQGTAHEIYGSEYDVIYYSYSLLVSKENLWTNGCPPQILIDGLYYSDTLVTYEEMYNPGQAYLTDEGGGFLKIPTVIKDFEDYAFLDGHFPEGFMNSISTITINKEPITGEDSQVILGLYYWTAAVGGHVSERRDYTATLNIIDNSQGVLTLEQYTAPEGRGFIKTIRIELQKR